MRLIDAEALDILSYLEEFPESEEDRAWNIAVRAVYDYINSADTVCSESIVKCKDCKWSDKNRRNIVEKRYQDNTLFCRNTDLCGDEPLVMYPDDFCSYGERKDVEDEV